VETADGLAVWAELEDHAADVWAGARHEPQLSFGVKMLLFRGLRRGGSFVEIELSQLS
jgi:hypothetical protein